MTTFIRKLAASALAISLILNAGSVSAASPTARSSQAYTQFTQQALIPTMTWWSRLYQDEGALSIRYKTSVIMTGDADALALADEHVPLPEWDSLQHNLRPSEWKIPKWFFQRLLVEEPSEKIMDRLIHVEHLVKELHAVHEDDRDEVARDLIVRALANILWIAHRDPKVKEAFNIFVEMNASNANGVILRVTKTGKFALRQAHAARYAPPSATELPQIILSGDFLEAVQVATLALIARRKELKKAHIHLPNGDDGEDMIRASMAQFVAQALAHELTHHDPSNVSDERYEEDRVARQMDLPMHRGAVELYGAQPDYKARKGSGNGNKAWTTLDALLDWLKHEEPALYKALALPKRYGLFRSWKDNDQKWLALSRYMARAYRRSKSHALSMDEKSDGTEPLDEDDSPELHNAEALQDYQMLLRRLKGDEGLPTQESLHLFKMLMKAVDRGKPFSSRGIDSNGFSKSPQLLHLALSAPHDFGPHEPALSAHLKRLGATVANIYLDDSKSLACLVASTPDLYEHVVMQDLLETSANAGPQFYRQLAVVLNRVMKDNAVLLLHTLSPATLHELKEYFGVLPVRPGFYLLINYKGQLSPIQLPNPEDPQEKAFMSLVSTVYPKIIQGLVNEVHQKWPRYERPAEAYLHRIRRELYTHIVERDGDESKLRWYRGLRDLLGNKCVLLDPSNTALHMRELHAGDPSTLQKYRDAIEILRLTDILNTSDPLQTVEEGDVYTWITQKNLDSPPLPLATLLSTAHGRILAECMTGGTNLLTLFSEPIIKSLVDSYPKMRKFVTQNDMSGLEEYIVTHVAPIQETRIFFTDRFVEWLEKLQIPDLSNDSMARNFIWRFIWDRAVFLAQLHSSAFVPGVPTRVELATPEIKALAFEIMSWTGELRLWLFEHRNHKLSPEALKRSWDKIEKGLIELHSAYNKSVYDARGNRRRPYLTATLLELHDALAFPVQPSDQIVIKPELYVVGPNKFEGPIRDKLTAHFKEYLKTSDFVLPVSAWSVLEGYLAHEMVALLTPRQVEEVVYTFMRFANGGVPVLRDRRWDAQQAAITDLELYYDKVKNESVDKEGFRLMKLAVGGNRATSGDFARYGGKDFKALYKYITTFRNEISLSTDHRERLVRELRNGYPRHVLYVLDNVVEDVFDLPLIQWILRQGHTVTVVTKSEEAHNDTTFEDFEHLIENPFLELLKMDLKGNLRLWRVSSGSSTRGTDLRRATPDFMKAWLKADVIIVKGEGNRGTLRTPAGLHKGFYSLVVGKSPEETNVPKGTGVVEWIPPGFPPQEPERRELLMPSVGPINVVLPKPVQKYADGLKAVPISGDTLGELIDNLIQRYPDLKPHLMLGPFHLLPYISLYVNEADVNMPRDVKIYRQYTQQNWREMLLKPTDTVRIAARSDSFLTTLETKQKAWPRLFLGLSLLSLFLLPRVPFQVWSIVTPAVLGFSYAIYHDSLKSSDKDQIREKIGIHGVSWWHESPRIMLIALALIFVPERGEEMKLDFLKAHYSEKELAEAAMGGIMGFELLTGWKERETALKTLIVVGPVGLLLGLAGINTVTKEYLPALSALMDMPLSFPILLDSLAVLENIVLHIFGPAAFLLFFFHEVHNLSSKFPLTLLRSPQKPDYSVELVQPEAYRQTLVDIEEAEAGERKYSYEQRSFNAMAGLLKSAVTGKKQLSAVFVARGADGTLLGAKIIYEESRAMTGWDGVRSSAQNRGIGRTLRSTAWRWLIEKGYRAYTEVLLYPSPGNLPSLQSSARDVGATLEKMFSLFHPTYKVNLPKRSTLATAA